jgi:hypothetical protein
MLKRRFLLTAIVATCCLCWLAPAAERPEQLQRHGELSVEVRTTDGRALAGVTVTLLREEAAQQREIAHGFTDGEGRVTIHVPSPGVYHLHAFLDGFVATSIGPLPLEETDREEKHLLTPLVLALNAILRS